MAEGDDPIHVIKEENLHSFEAFHTDPDLKKYHAGYEAYCQQYYDLTGHNRKKAMTEADRKEARKNLMDVIKENHKTLTDSDD